MKNLARLLPLFLLTLSVPVLAEDVPRYTIEEFLATTSMRGAAFTHDGERILVSSDASGVFNAVEIPVDGSERIARTESTTHPVWPISYFPHDERFLYTQDEGGNELNHVFVRNLDGTSVDLTPGEKLKANWVGWTAARDAFFLSTNERDPRHFDLYRYDTESLERTLVYTNEEGFAVGPVSADGSWVALVRTIDTTTSELYLQSLTRSEDVVTISPENPKGTFAAMDFSPDGQTLLFGTNHGEEFVQLHAFDLNTNQQRQVLESQWDIVGAEYSHGGKLIAVAANVDAATEVSVYQTDSMEALDLTFPVGTLSSTTFSPDDTQLAFYASSGQSPANLYVMELSQETARQLTHNLNPNIDPAHLVAEEMVRFDSYDGLEIPGVLYLPHDATAQNRAPALVWVHGGPGGQSRAGYRGAIQFLVNHGYVVYAINNRGSSGYGQTFFTLDDRKHGEADLGDVVASKEMLIDTGVVDPDRIGIIGGSYGGYMVLAALTLAPTEFVVGVDLFGISNWVRTLESIPPWWESFRLALYKELGDPTEDRERLHRISPIFNADKIERPLMVLQGANDPRVLQVESDEIVAAVRERGIPCEYIVFDDEGHGFRKKANRQTGYQAILEFLDTHLRVANPAG